MTFPSIIFHQDFYIELRLFSSSNDIDWYHRLTQLAFNCLDQIKHHDI